MAGCTYYLFFRRTPLIMPASQYFSGWLQFRSEPSIDFIAMQSVPSFIHVFSYSILSTLAFQVLRLRIILGSCFTWTLINILFELGQLLNTKQSRVLADHPYDLLPVPVYQYFVSGTFDWWDIVSCVGGGATALFFLLFLVERTVKNA